MWRKGVTENAAAITVASLIVFFGIVIVLNMWLSFIDTGTNTAKGTEVNQVYLDVKELCRGDNVGAIEGGSVTLADESQLTSVYGEGRDACQADKEGVLCLETARESIEIGEASEIDSSSCNSVSIAQSCDFSGNVLSYNVTEEGNSAVIGC